MLAVHGDRARTMDARGSGQSGARGGAPGRWVLWLAAEVGVACGLAACGKGGTEAPPPDVFGCPALAGTYAIPEPDTLWPSFDGTPWERFTREDGAWFPLAWFDQVTLSAPAPGMLEARFRVRLERIREQIAGMHELGGPRYARWHALVQPAARASYEQAYGAGAYAEQLRAVAPLTEVTWSGVQGRDFRCDDGELVFTRRSGKPLRVGHGPEGGVLVHGTEITSVGIPVWCGDGCKELPIPTGTRDARVEWWSTPARPDWSPDVAALEPPREAVAEAERVRLARQEAIDRRVFAPASEIRARLTPLLPPGGTLESVEVRDGAVHVVHRAREGQEKEFTRAVAAFGERPIGLQVVYVTSRPTQRDVTFRLVDSALVQRTPPPAQAGGSGAATAPTVLPTLVPVAPAPNASALRSRAQALLPGGMRVDAARVSGEAVFLTGTAPRNAVVSDGLRALDAAAQGREPRVELLSVEMREGAVRYEIRVPAAILATP